VTKRIVTDKSSNVKFTPEELKKLAKFDRRNIYDHPFRGANKQLVNRAISSGLMQRLGIMAHQQTVYLTDLGRAALAPSAPATPDAAHDQLFVVTDDGQIRLTAASRQNPKAVFTPDNTWYMTGVNAATLGLDAQGNLKDLAIEGKVPTLKERAAYFSGYADSLKADEDMGFPPEPTPDASDPALTDVARNLLSDIEQTPLPLRFIFYLDAESIEAYLSLKKQGFIAPDKITPNTTFYHITGAGKNALKGGKS
jgi:hypothetical protein